MKVDVGKVFNGIVSELVKGRRVGDSMNCLVDVCETCYAHRDWARFRNLQYDDLGALSRWVQGVFQEWPGEPLRGLWFGLFNPVREGGETVTDLHVCGSKEFSPDDVDWAVHAEWRPSATNAGSAVLSKLYRLAHSPGGLELEAEYPLCLAYAALAIRRVLGAGIALPPAIGAEPIGVAVGYDDGDFIVIGELSKRGFAVASGT